MPEQFYRSKIVSDSKVIATHVVMPSDVNFLGTLAGGTLMHWMDLAASTAASRHANSVCVTASVDSIEFKSPVKLGEAVIIHAQVNRAFKTSMEIGVKVYSEDVISGDQKICNRAYFTFVAVDKDLKPQPIPKLFPETDEEVKRYEEAYHRRKSRLANKSQQD